MILIKISAPHINSLSRLFHFFGSFAVQNGDHLGSGIICGPILGSFAVLGSFADPYSTLKEIHSFQFPYDHLHSTRAPPFLCRHYLAKICLAVFKRIGRIHITLEKTQSFQLCCELRWQVHADFRSEVVKLQISVAH